VHSGEGLHVLQRNSAEGTHHRSSRLDRANVVDEGVIGIRVADGVEYGSALLGILLISFL
jgi:hypothetical protein